MKLVVGFHKFHIRHLVISCIKTRIYCAGFVAEFVFALSSFLFSKPMMTTTFSLIYFYLRTVFALQLIILFTQLIFFQSRCNRTFLSHTIKIYTKTIDSNQYFNRNDDYYEYEKKIKLFFRTTNKDEQERTQSPINDVRYVNNERHPQ